MVNLLLLDLHDPCRSVWHVHGVGPGRERWAFQGESGTLSSLLGNDEAGLQKPEWLQQSWDSAACPAVPILCSSGAVDAELSIIPFHLWSVVELSPPPGCLGCVPWDSSVCADFNMQLAESGRLSADWEIILPRFTLWYILFWGTEQKTFNRVWFLGKPLWCHKCWHTSFRLSVISQAMLCILPGGTWCTVLERGVKRKKKNGWKYLRSHPLLWHFFWDDWSSSIPVFKARLFSFPNQPCRLLRIFKLIFLLHSAQMSC